MIRLILNTPYRQNFTHIITFITGLRECFVLSGFFLGGGSIFSSPCEECPRLVEPPRKIRNGVVRIIWQKLRSYKVLFWIPSLCYVNAKCNSCILSILKCFLNKTDIINISFLPNFSFTSLFVLWRELSREWAEVTHSYFISCCSAGVPPTFFWWWWWRGGGLLLFVGRNHLCWKEGLFFLGERVIWFLSWP